MDPEDAAVSKLNLRQGYENEEDNVDNIDSELMFPTPEISDREMDSEDLHNLINGITPLNGISEYDIHKIFQKLTGTYESRNDNAYNLRDSDKITKSFSDNTSSTDSTIKPSEKYCEEVILPYLKSRSECGSPRDDLVILKDEPDDQPDNNSQSSQPAIKEIENLNNRVVPVINIDAILQNLVTVFHLEDTNAEKKNNVLSCILSGPCLNEVEGTIGSQNSIKTSHNNGHTITCDRKEKNDSSSFNKSPLFINEQNETIFFPPTQLKCKPKSDCQSQCSCHKKHNKTEDDDEIVYPAMAVKEPKTANDKPLYYLTDKKRLCNPCKKPFDPCEEDNKECTPPPQPKTCNYEHSEVGVVYPLPFNRNTTKIQSSDKNVEVKRIVNTRSRDLLTYNTSISSQKVQTCLHTNTGTSTECARYDRYTRDVEEGTDRIFKQMKDFCGNIYNAGVEAATLISNGLYRPIFLNRCVSVTSDASTNTQTVAHNFIERDATDDLKDTKDDDRNKSVVKLTLDAVKSGLSFIETKEPNNSHSCEKTVCDDLEEVTSVHPEATVVSSMFNSLRSKMIQMFGCAQLAIKQSVSMSLTEATGSFSDVVNSNSQISNFTHISNTSVLYSNDNNNFVNSGNVT